MKSYTDLEQSKKLVEILPLESADMMYHSVETEYGSGAFVATSKGGVKRMKRISVQFILM